MRAWISVSAPIGSINSACAAIVSRDFSGTAVKARGLMPTVTLEGLRRDTAGSAAISSGAPPSITDALPSPNAWRSASTRFICGVPMKLATKTFTGLANTSCGVPTCSITPSFMMAMRLAMVSASSWSWVTITVALERPVSTSLIWPRMECRSSTSRRDSGSSNRKQFGSRTMARATARRCFSPSEIWFGMRSSTSTRCMILATFITRVSMSALERPS